MKPLRDARFAFLQDPDLYDLVGRLLLRMVRDEPFAEDIRQGAYVVAMKLVRGPRAPVPGTERGWMCRVARNHAYAELRRRKNQEQPVGGDDEPDLPVADHQALYEEQQQFEKLLDAVAQVAAANPDQAAQLLAVDARTKEGAGAGAKDAASRKRRERARTALEVAVGAALAVALLLLWVRSEGRDNPAGRPPEVTYESLARESRDDAHRRCEAQEWLACLEGLDRARAIDPRQFGSAEREAWSAAVAGLRQKALADCASGELTPCLEELEIARRYDPDGDDAAAIRRARSDARARLGAEAGASASAPDAAGALRRDR